MKDEKGSGKYQEGSDRIIKLTKEEERLRNEFIEAFELNEDKLKEESIIGDLAFKIMISKFMTYQAVTSQLHEARLDFITKVLAEMTGMIANSIISVQDSIKSLKEKEDKINLLSEKFGYLNRLAEELKIKESELKNNNDNIDKS